MPAAPTAFPRAPYQNGRFAPGACRARCPAPPLAPAAAVVVDRDGAGGRAWHAPAAATGRTTLRAGRTCHGGERRVAATAPGQRAVRREAAGVHVAAGRCPPGGRQLAVVVPAAVAAGRAAQPVAGVRPGAPAMVATPFAVRTWRTVLHPAVRPDGQARADRHGAGGHDHAGPVGPTAPPLRAPQPAGPVAGRLRRRRRHGDQGGGLPALADGAALAGLAAVPAPSRPAGGRPPPRQPAVADSGLPAGHGGVAGTAGLGAAA